MATKIKGLAEKYPLVAYVVINYMISWTFLYPGYKLLLAAKGSFPPLALFGLIGGYGPSIATLLMLALSGGWNTVKAGLRKFVQWRERWYWYLFVLFVPVCACIAAVLLNIRPGVDFKGGLQTILWPFLSLCPLDL
jgi:hypothetical protein